MIGSHFSSLNYSGLCICICTSGCFWQLHGTGLEPGMLAKVKVPVGDEVVETLLARPELAAPVARTAKESRWQQWENQWQQWQTEARQAAHWLWLRRRLLLAVGTPVMVILAAVLISTQLSRHMSGLTGLTIPIAAAPEPEERRNRNAGRP